MSPSTVDGADHGAERIVLTEAEQPPATPARTGTVAALPTAPPSPAVTPGHTPEQDSPPGAALLRSAVPGRGRPGSAADRGVPLREAGPAPRTGRRWDRWTGPGGRHRPARRIPSTVDGRRLLVICGWATALGAVALASGLRGLVLVLAGQTPPWYQPTMAALGLGGIVLGVLALGGHARPALPWTALGLANLVVGVSAGLTASLP